MIDKCKNIFKRYFKPLIIYEFIFLLLVSLIATPISFHIGDLLYNKNDFSPTNILITALLLSCIAIIIIFNKINIIIILDRLDSDKSLNITKIIKIAFDKFFILFRLENIKVLLLELMLMPFLYMTFITYFIILLLQKTNINSTYIVLAIIIYLLLVIPLLSHIYLLNYFLIEEKRFSHARKASINLSKKYLAKDTTYLVIIQVIMIPLLLLLVVTNNALINSDINNFSLSLVWIIDVLIISIYIILVNMNISLMFYKHKRSKREEFKNIRYFKSRNKLGLVPRILFFTYIIFSCLLCFAYINENNNKQTEKLVNTKITAHRGSSLAFPENTMAAFKGAKAEHADWIEIDVRQTKDKKLIVFHDDNLERITGINKEISDTTYDELKDLDCGSYLDPQFSNQRIPLLDDVIKYAKDNNIKLNIELKTTGKEENYENELVEIIEKNHFVSHCIVETSSYKQITELKKLNPHIKTAYLIDTPTEDLFYLDDADAISMSLYTINSYFINQLHKAGKEVLVWTVNSEEDIRELIALEVDNIITDNVTLGIELLKEWQQKQAADNEINKKRK